MARKRLFTLVLTIILIVAFAGTCMGATTTVQKDSKSKTKVIVKAKKPAIKAAVKKPAAKAATKATAKTTVKAAGAAATAAAVKPVVSKAASFGLTADKAKAFDLLINCKYSGKANGKIDADIRDIAIIGELKCILTTNSTGNKTLCSTDGLPFGGDFKDKAVNMVPFNEIVNGKDVDIANFLKKATQVTVAGNVITITKAIPPASLMGVMNSINKDEKWIAKDLYLDGTITVGKTAVESVDLKMGGNSHGTQKPHPVDVSIKINF